MTYEMYRYVFLGAAAGCGLFFVISVVLFFTLKIPRVINDLSGRTAKKAIANIRMQNEQSGDKTYRSSPVNLERGKITDRISKSGSLIRREETPFGVGHVTEKIDDYQMSAGETSVLESANETTVLGAMNGTTVLGAMNGTTVLGAANETTVLNMGYGETSVLDAAMPMAAPAVTVTGEAFTIEYEITYIHTSEIIV